MPTLTIKIIEKQFPAPTPEKPDQKISGFESEYNIDFTDGMPLETSALRILFPHLQQVINHLIAQHIGPIVHTGKGDLSPTNVEIAIELFTGKAPDPNPDDFPAELEATDLIN